MRPQRFSVRHLSVLTVVTLLSVGLTTVAVAQSQEPKPELPATPVSLPATPASAESGHRGIRIVLARSELWCPD